MKDITPTTHFLESIRADVGSYWQLLAEGVDNSFDAGAIEVHCRLDKDEIVIKDDGVGITKDRQLALVRLGEHRSMATTNLGRFGIGIKYQAASAGETLAVESVSKDGRMMLRADWRKVIQFGKWEIDDPKWISTIHNKKTGTSIVIGHLRWKHPQMKDLKVSAEKLAQLFYPAMASERRIYLNGERLPVLREPEMSDIVEGNVLLASGKGAHVRAGIMLHPSSASSLYQIQVSYKHRVIKPQSIFGCGTFSGLRRMFGRVDLTGPWGLTRFKDELADNDADELEDAVLEILRPILERCHSAQMSAQLNEMTALLNEMLPSELAAARPVRTKEKDGLGQKHNRNRHGQITRNADESIGGPAKKAKARQQLVINFEEPLVEEYGYGRFIAGKPGRIVLASDNPHIASLLEIRDKILGAQSLYQIAMAIYIQQSQPVQGNLFDPNTPFGLQVWQLTKSQNVLSETASA